MSIFEQLSESKAFRIKRKAQEAGAKIAHHVSMNGASNAPWIGDVTFKTENTTTSTGNHELTCGLEFTYNHPDGQKRYYRIEGPRWFTNDPVARLTAEDMSETQMQIWCRTIEGYAPLFRQLADQGAMLLEGVIDWSLWGNFPVNADLLVFCWTNSEYEYDEIPWGHVLPVGMIHVISPTLQTIKKEQGGADFAMASIADAVQTELESRKVMWVQFNNDFVNHQDIRAAVGVGGDGEYLHCLNAGSVHEFLRIWQWANKELSPRVWVLYNPWEAPLYPKDAWASDMDDPNIKTWTKLLGDLLLPEHGTMIVLNRVPASKIESVNLAPWNCAEHIQNFHEEAECEHDWKPAALGPSSEIHECSKCGETERRDRPL